ncbi:hypothetical protein [Lysobacter capsici]|uniref:hypothetical protein n=1 Tax=Lysobacter capsici TaxID=435897 RepID=UPI0007165137|nr:hypothetical protein [Lysobacter capsici]
MSTVIQMHAHPRLLHVVRTAINQRARSTKATESTRLRALAEGFAALRAGRSTGCAIALGNSEMRVPRRRLATGPAPEAA